MRPEIPPGALTTTYNSIQAGLRAMSPEARRAYFKKLKVGAILTLLNVSQDAMADWDGMGDVQLKGVPDSTVRDVERVFQDHFGTENGRVEEFFMAGIDEEPQSD